MISTLFSSLNTKLTESEDNEAQSSSEQKEARQQPVLIIIQQTMPIFKEIATLWFNEISVIEVNIHFHQNLSLSSRTITFFDSQGLCSCLKYAITNLMDDFEPMLSELCNLIVTILQSKCVSPAIDIAKTVSLS